MHLYEFIICSKQYQIPRKYFNIKLAPPGLGIFHHEDTISYVIPVKQYLYIITSRLCMIHAKRYVICTPYIYNYLKAAVGVPFVAHKFLHMGQLQLCNCFWHQWLVQSFFVNRARCIMNGVASAFIRDESEIKHCMSLAFEYSMTDHKSQISTT